MKGVNDMRYKKANKIMMIVVSLLLALVLMTTCILSGIYAKYITQSKTETKIKLKQFDITITIDYNAVIDTAIANGKITTTQRTDEKGQEVVGITLQGLKLAPGDDYWNAISIKMAGSADVPIKVKVTPTASFNNENTQDNNNFYVQSGVGGLTKDGAVMPYGFTFGIYDSKITKNDASITYEQTSVVDPCLRTGIGIGIADGMIAKVSDFDRSNQSSKVIYKEFQAGIPISFTSKADGTTSDEIFFGFYWPYDYAGTYVHSDGTTNEITNDGYNEISTWLAANREPILNLTYEIEVSQK